MILDINEFSRKPDIKVKSKVIGNDLFDLPGNGYLYFIGIGGVGMSSVAMMMKNNGYMVMGSDAAAGPTTRALENIGVKIDFQQDGQWIDRKTDLIVTSAAIPNNNLDLIKAKALGIKVIKYSQLLGLLMRGKEGIAVSGTHGKTTTTAMISAILKGAGLDPACVIGGETSKINDEYSRGKGDLFVAEACEYDRTFLSLSPKIAVITSIDEDHLDYYKDMDMLRLAFAEFAGSVPKNGLIVVNGFDSNIKIAMREVNCNIETYTADNYKRTCNDNPSKRFPYSTHNAEPITFRSTWQSTMPVLKDGKNYFRVFYKGDFFGDFYLIVPGIHNVMNALASIAVCHKVAVDKYAIFTALSTFKGVNRRFQIVGNVNGITIVDDYAHHPTAIETTLKTARDVFSGRRIWCLYQPHQYSRTKLLLERFVHSFEHADKIILTEIYSARDSIEDKKAVSSSDIVIKMKRMGKDAEFIPNLSDAADTLCGSLESGDVLIIMGAGDVWKAADDIVKCIQ